MKIKLYGWEDGLQKLTLTKLQMAILDIGLKEAKTNVDELLDDKIVCISVDNREIAEEFCREAQSIGTLCRIED